jgi:Putative collagen-binding domain of a collagenase
VTAARTADGRLAIAYLPAGQTIRVNMAELAGRVRARWYDPSTGRYRAVRGARLANAGIRRFSPPGKNGDGDPDWVLVLEAG